MGKKKDQRFSTMRDCYQDVVMPHIDIVTARPATDELLAKSALIGVAFGKAVHDSGVDPREGELVEFLFLDRELKTTMAAIDSGEFVLYKAADEALQASQFDYVKVDLDTHLEGVKL